jgi:hypothetical protein
MKKEPDALGTAKNVSGSAKREKRNLTPSVPPKMSQGAQIMKTGPDGLGTTKNEFGSSKHENWTLRSRYRRK